jgi:hypothetical protein
MTTSLKFFFLTAICLIHLTAHAQDIITKKDGTDVQAKILEVTPQEIKFKKFDNPEGPIFTLLTSEILMVKYENGTRDVFDQKNSNASTVAEYYELGEKGRQDALLFYSGNKSGRGGVVATAVLLGPVIGLIPAAIISSSQPDEQNLNTPEPELMRNPSYRIAYTDQAEKTKKKKIWKAYGIASGVWLGLFLIASAASQ